ncbi:MAG: heparinase II/III family protein [Phycisphaerales bacterium]|nr:heparinase II/III family protein [Phycisphaerales bacterium]MCB9857685.1 heparinase II/III family protein [Phycisphaerales bacterium]MCB9864774.1 heparinase II/III family protein [Phycisphaerales bacterium]
MYPTRRQTPRQETTFGDRRIGLLIASMLALLVAGTCELSNPAADSAPRPAAIKPLSVEAHPFILATPETIAVIRDRTTREPAKTWVEQLQRRCPADADITATTNVDERLSLARDAALCYLLTSDEAMANRAARLLAETPLLDDAVTTNDGLHAFVGRVPRYCEAYDLLKTLAPDLNLNWRINADDDAMIRNHIAAMARWLRDNRPFWYDFTRNNWAIRQYAALAICTMTIADGTPDLPATVLRNWYEYARRETALSLDAQVCPEGAFAEGCGYMNYAAENYIPMFFAVRNLQGDDLFAEPRYQANFEWLTRIRTPAGHLPNFDDAPLSQFPTHYLTSACADAGLFEWDWQRAGRPTMDLCRAICWHDDGVQPVPPAIEPSLILPEAGNAILRSSWDADAIYLLLLGEHGQPRTSGYGHEHPDNTSFMIEAFGEPLAIDSGYIDFPNHTLVNRPENHNLILIDDTGPALLQIGNQPLVVDQDAFIEDAVVDGPVPQCTVRTNYANTEIRRTILMPGHDHFVIVDTLRPASGNTHKFTWVLHGNAGVDESAGGTGGGFELGDNFARWTRPDGVALQLWLTSSAGPPAIRERFDEDGELYRNQLTGHGPSSILRHRTVEGIVESRDAVFLAVLLPVQNASDLPKVDEISRDAAIAFKLTFPNESRIETIRVASNVSGRPVVSIRAIDADGATIYESKSD